MVIDSGLPAQSFMKNIIAIMSALFLTGCFSVNKDIHRTIAISGETSGDYIVRLEKENAQLRLQVEWHKSEAKKVAPLYERLDLLEQINEYLRKNCLTK
jgi:hypothetical protein